MKKVVAALEEVPVRGIISDGQHSIRNAVKSVLAKVPHQLCQFHYLREAARTVFEADRHAKKELKKRLRGVRLIERKLQGQEEEEEATTVMAESIEESEGLAGAVRNGMALLEGLLGSAPAKGVRRAA